MSIRRLQGLLLVPQPWLTVAYLVAVATYQVPADLAPLVALALLPAVALGLAFTPRGRSRLLVLLGLVEIGWALAAIAIVWRAGSGIEGR